MLNKISTIVSISVSLICIMLNLLLGGHPWSVYVVLGVSIFPLTTFLLDKRNFKLYSITLTLILFTLIIAIDLITGNGLNFAHYSLLVLMWWPLCMLLSDKTQTLSFMIFIAIFVILVSFLIYYTNTNGVFPWHIYSIPLGLSFPIAYLLLKSKNIETSIVYTILFLLISGGIIFIIHLLTNTYNY